MTIRTTSIAQAKSSLDAGDIIAIPTETVYGLAANAFNDNAVRKIFTLKNRPHFNPLIVHIQSANYLDQIAIHIPPLARQLAAYFWPGPLTLILEKRDNISSLVTADKHTVAVRVPKHPLTQQLLEVLDYPLAAPSANPFGSISSTSPDHVYDYFKDNLPLILDGGTCERGIESTIIGFEDGVPILFRHGSIAIEEIEKVVGSLRTKTSNNRNLEAPGMLSKHYAPRTPFYLTADVGKLANNFVGKRVGVLVFKTKVASNLFHQEVLSENGDLKEAASNLYDVMHRLDSLSLDVIIAEELPKSNLGISINDRLKRAAQNR